MVKKQRQLQVASKSLCTGAARGRATAGLERSAVAISLRRKLKNISREDVRCGLKLSFPVRNTRQCARVVYG